MVTRKKAAARTKRTVVRAEAPVIIDGAASEGGSGVLVPLPNYTRMTEVMKELAMRDTKHEAAVVRIANAGGIVPVQEYVQMMRKYQKKHKK